MEISQIPNKNIENKIVKLKTKNQFGGILGRPGGGG
jgi:hypothetical protein